MSKQTAKTNHTTNNNNHGGSNGAVMPQPVHAFRSARFLQDLETEIHIRREQLEALETAHRVLLGTPMGSVISTHATTTTAPTTVADAVAQLLGSAKAVNGQMHLTQLLELLDAEYNMKTTPKNLVNTLNRWVGRGKKFRRTNPNTFALISGERTAARAG